MGGHSKKSGKGGGGGGRHKNGGRGKPQERKKLSKDPGVPDLKDVARKLTNTAQRRTHSVLSIPGMHNQVKSGAALGGGAASSKGFGLLKKRVTEQVTAELTEEERRANRRREMAALALRSTEKVHDYEAPMMLYGGDGNDDEGMLVEDVDNRGTDKSLRRFFKEFQRVVENCDVLLQVLDARDPLGCRLTQLEKSIRSSYGEERKKIVVVLNKVDMLPSKEVVDAWIDYFENHENVMCIPFAATAKGSTGQTYVHNMFKRLRALARNDETGDRKAIVVGVIGYPNVGKSSIINALKRRNVVGVGNMPGFTTGNTEVELRSDIRVMDCPGVVSPGEDNGDVVLRNAVRVSELANPFTPVQRLLQRCTSATDLDAAEDNEEEEGYGGGPSSSPESRAVHQVHPLARFYGIGSFAENDVMAFIHQVGLRRGRLTKGGAVDEESTARMVLTDWNDGRIAYYTYPPATDDFFSAGDFRVGASGERDEDDGHCNGPQVVSHLARGITMDGLPTFHLWLNKADGPGRQRKKRWMPTDDEQDWGNDEEDDDDDVEL